MSASGELKGPDLKQGVAATALADGEMLLGHADGQAVLLARGQRAWCEITLQRGGTGGMPEILSTRHRAAFEILTDAAAHGVAMHA